MAHHNSTPNAAAVSNAEMGAIRLGRQWTIPLRYLWGGQLVCQMRRYGMAPPLIGWFVRCYKVDGKGGGGKGDAMNVLVTFVAHRYSFCVYILYPRGYGYGFLRLL
jgi:hypothetical protein